MNNSQLVNASCGGPLGISAWFVSRVRSSGWRRVLAIFLLHGHKTTHERAHTRLFVIGIIVEILLIASIFRPIALTLPPAAKLFTMCVMLLVMWALPVHQYLIFRNFTLHKPLADYNCPPLELLICSLFGVLTGELGYMLVVILCGTPHWLRNPAAYGIMLVVLSLPFFVVAARLVVCATGNSVRRLRHLGAAAMLLFPALLLFTLGLCGGDWLAMRDTREGLEWIFADEPLRPADALSQRVDPSMSGPFDYVMWFGHAIGIALKSVFAFAAATLSWLILAWDIESAPEPSGADPVVSDKPHSSNESLSDDDDAAMEFRENKSAKQYRKVHSRFVQMDLCAWFLWLMIFGAILPDGVLAMPGGWKLDKASCGYITIGVGLLYAGMLWIRLSAAADMLATCDTDAAAREEII